MRVDNKAGELKGDLMNRVHVPPFSCQHERGGHHLVVSLVLGAGFFFMGEEVWPQAPFLHAAWHLFGAAAISTANDLIFGPG
jgi:hypothetical protein